MNLLQKLKPKAEEPTGVKGHKTMPTVRCTDPAFKYTPSVKTDLHKTFSEARQRMGLVKP
jgi:hypothetical protein